MGTVHRKKGKENKMVVKLLKKLKDEGKINVQAYRTYKGQVMSGDDIGCVKGLIRKKLITKAQGEELIDEIKLAYTE